jgi:hypothetical protein
MGHQELVDQRALSFLLICAILTLQIFHSVDIHNFCVVPSPLGYGVSQYHSNLPKILQLFSSFEAKLPLPIVPYMHWAWSLYFKTKTKY